MSGTIRLFRWAGVTVYLHFTWFLVAAYFVTSLARRYQSPVWAVYEYVALFAIVLAHEFGHALACRSTGGVANRIILWPLGGIAFVNPPPRPGAMLWSIAAGPLVNVALVPVLQLLVLFVGHSSLHYNVPDIYRLVVDLNWINYLLLIFNLLPIYPLDGGQILRALLWFPFGQIRSLQVASVIGLIGGALMALAAVWLWSLWYGVLGFFVLSRAAAGWQEARALIQQAELSGGGSNDSMPPPPLPR